MRIFSRLVVNPGDPHRTDLLMGESPETNQSEIGSPKGVISPRGIASAYEKGKERGILWGGMDFHSALLNENYLRFVLNAIVWDRRDRGSRRRCKNSCHPVAIGAHQQSLRQLQEARWICRGSTASRTDHPASSIEPAAPAQRQPQSRWPLGKPVITGTSAQAFRDSLSRELSR